MSLTDIANLASGPTNNTTVARLILQDFYLARKNFGAVNFFIADVFCRILRIISMGNICQ